MVIPSGMLRRFNLTNNYPDIRTHLFAALWTSVSREVFAMFRKHARQSFSSSEFAIHPESWLNVNYESDQANFPRSVWPILYGSGKDVPVPVSARKWITRSPDPPPRCIHVDLSNPAPLEPDRIWARESSPHTTYRYCLGTNSGLSAELLVFLHHPTVLHW